MIESLAARMKHWRSGDPLERTSLAWFLHVAQQIEIARAKAQAAKYAPRLVALPIAGDPAEDAAIAESLWASVRALRELHERTMPVGEALDRLGKRQ